MTRFRKKTNPRLKRCKVQISENCEILFKTKHKRPKACNVCKQMLKQLGITYEFYRSKKMNNILKEEMNWTNSNEGIMTIESEIPVKQNDKVIGKKTDVTVVNVTYKDVVDGLMVVEERIKKTNQKINQKELELAQLGGKSELSNELAELRNNILEIDRILKGQNTSNELENLKNELEKDINWMNLRKKVLESRPKEIKKE